MINTLKAVDFSYAQFYKLIREFLAIKKKIDALDYKKFRET